MLHPHKAGLMLAVLALFGLAVSRPAATQIMPPPGNAAFLSLFGDGVQIYDSSPDSTTPGAFVWKFIAPEANLFTDASETTLVGTHFAGPTWEWNADGSEVVGTRIASRPSPHPGSIPELLLKAKSHTGAGVFDDVTYIQRLNTIGGLAPSAPPTATGEEFRSHYTATYRFFAPVPEPGPIALLVGLAVSSTALFRRRRRSYAP